jgi:hypothetical protein
MSATIEKKNVEVVVVSILQKFYKSHEIFKLSEFSQIAGTAHPLEQMRASSNQIIVFTQLEIYKLQSIMSSDFN